MEHARHHQLPIEARSPDEKASGLGVHTENIIDGMDKIGAMAALVESVIVWRAQYIAWNSDISMAETLLSRLVFKEGSRNPQAMDLLARIYFQRGKYEDARGLWDKALELQPGNPALRRTVEEMRRIAESPGSTVARHRISVFLNYLLALLVICIAGLAIPHIHKRMMRWAYGTPMITVQNTEERSSGSHYKKYAPTFKDNVRSRFDYFIPYPFSATDIGKHAPNLENADFSESEGTRSIWFTGKKTAGNRKLGRIEVVVERVGDTLRASGKIPNLYIRYLVEEALWKMPGITDLDLSGLVVDRTYRINRGDSLWIIAKRIYGQGASWNLLSKANDLGEPNEKLEIGEEPLPPMGDEILAEDTE
jgi:hypothetical protein